MRERGSVGGAVRVEDAPCRWSSWFGQVTTMPGGRARRGSGHEHVLGAETDHVVHDLLRQLAVVGAQIGRPLDAVVPGQADVHVEPVGSCEAWPTT